MVTESRATIDPDHVGWNVDTLKQHYDRVLHEHAVAHKAEHEAADVAIMAAFKSAEKAIEKQEAVTESALGKQETATDHRFESVNEFRSLVNDVLKRLELAQADTLSLREFKEYCDRQDQRGRESRLRIEAERLAAARARAAIVVGVLLALFTAVVSVALALAGRA